MTGGLGKIEAAQLAAQRTGGAPARTREGGGSGLAVERHSRWTRVSISDREEEPVPRSKRTSPLHLPRGEGER